MWEPVTHHQAALTVRLVASLERHDDLAVSMIGIAPDDVFFGGFEHTGKRRFIDGLSGVGIERGFDIETLHMTQAAAEKDPDNRLGLGWKMRLAVGCRPGRMRGGGFLRACQHGRERQSGEAQSGICQKGATGDTDTAAGISGA